ncbi:dihydrodipicolinate synthase family protein [Rhizosaccharibacter radicis]|uniref:Dihydrodipicolinate synthase family protein n=1 Tax=Rhizosaccharibacter radicis TaxID=2782605 RepID=A0ABT1VYY3_9PROT|nr:dihydrodipicolinate synthase family protein [Acetobacteraceae bacterium KSS12]
MSVSSGLFRGLCAFPLTPTDADGTVRREALAGLVRRLGAAAVDSVCVLGSTGTFAYLDRRARRAAIESAAAELGGRVPLMAGVGALRTEDAVLFAQDAAAIGADALLLPAMSYTPLVDEEVLALAAAVCAATALPVCFYDNPSTTRFAATPVLAGRLAGLPTLKAMKLPAPPPREVGAQLDAFRACVPAGFSLGHSVDWHAAGALAAGSDGWYSVLAGLFPEICLAMLAAVREEDVGEMDILDRRLRPLWAQFRTHGSLRVVHAAAEILGLCPSILPRPLLPLPDAARQEVVQALRHAGLA